MAAQDQNTLRLEVATPEGLKLEADAESVQAPSVHGEFGVLPGHLPLLAALQCGLLKYRAGGKDQVAAIGPGFVQAEPGRVLLLTDLFALPDGVDTDAVRKELAEAEKKLAEYPERHEGPDYRELQRDIDWALARIEARQEADK
ncbi:MAG: ATP synthase F1 subunit epsilon [Myxococcota bacterium]